MQGFKKVKKNYFQENTGQTRGPSGLDLNVEPVWMQRITGDGVVVGIVDDGQLDIHDMIYVCRYLHASSLAKVLTIIWELVETHFINHIQLILFGT